MRNSCIDNFISDELRKANGFNQAEEVNVVYFMNKLEDRILSSINEHFKREGNILKAHKDLSFRRAMDSIKEKINDTYVKAKADCAKSTYSDLKFIKRQVNQ